MRLLDAVHGLWAQMLIEIAAGLNAALFESLLSAVRAINSDKLLPERRVSDVVLINIRKFLLLLRRHRVDRRYNMHSIRIHPLGRDQVVVGRNIFSFFRIFFTHAFTPVIQVLTEQYLKNHTKSRCLYDIWGTCEKSCCHDLCWSRVRATVWPTVSSCL